jgi:hypothetical protein
MMTMTTHWGWCRRKYCTALTAAWRNSEKKKTVVVNLWSSIDPVSKHPLLFFLSFSDSHACYRVLEDRAVNAYAFTLYSVPFFCSSQVNCARGSSVLQYMYSSSTDRKGKRSARYKCPSGGWGRNLPTCLAVNILDQVHAQDPNLGPQHGQYGKFRSAL